MITLSPPDRNVLNIFDFKSMLDNHALTHAEYAKRLYPYHLALSDYAKLAAQTNIKRILLENGEVTMTTNRDVVFKCIFSQYGGVPLDIVNSLEEENELICVLNLISKNDIIFDIGANFGFYSLNISKKFESTKILSFEPMNKTREILLNNINLNHAKNIIIYPFGFWNKDTTLEFNYHKNASGATSIANILEGEDIEKISSPVRTIDSFIAEYNIPDINFIKCDVEGAEYFVLQGGYASIKKYIPIIFLEMLRKWSKKYGYHPNDIIAYLKNIGYNCYEILNQGRLVLFSKMTEETKSTNFIFLHQDNHKTAIEKFTD
jgi:FkbM family methyltransferase